MPPGGGMNPRVCVRPHDPAGGPVCFAPAVRVPSCRRPFFAAWQETRRVDRRRGATPRLGLHRFGRPDAAPPYTTTERVIALLTMPALGATGGRLLAFCVQPAWTGKKEGEPLERPGRVRTLCVGAMWGLQFFGGGQVDLQIRGPGGLNFAVIGAISRCICYLLPGGRMRAKRAGGAVRGVQMRVARV